MQSLASQWLPACSEDMVYLEGLWKDANMKRHLGMLSGGTGITPLAVHNQCHSFQSQQLYTDSTSLCQCDMRISVAKRNLMLWHMPTKHQGTRAIKGPLVNGSNQ